MVPTGMLPDQEADRLKGIWVSATTAYVRKVTTWQHRGHERGQVEGWGLKARPDKDWNIHLFRARQAKGATLLIFPG